MTLGGMARTMMEEGRLQVTESPYGGDMGMTQRLYQEVMFLKQDSQLIKDAINGLEGDRDSLRQGIRKLKVENNRLKAKLRKVGQAAGAEVEGDEWEEVDLDSLKDFIIVGGPQDPFSLRFEATIKDAAELEHKSAERYLWYKMAETFGDLETGEKIREATTAAKAEEEMGRIKNFDEVAWNVVKMKYWEEGQRLKLEQHKWIANVLVFSEKIYVAVASQDKVTGTGWRKPRQEAGQPRMWDGANEGGKVLMRLRQTLATEHSWEDDAEKAAAKKKYEELKRTYWRRPVKRDGDGQGQAGQGRGGGGGGGFGGRGGRGMGGTGRGGRGGGMMQKRGRY